MAKSVFSCRVGVETLQKIKELCDRRGGISQSALLEQLVRNAHSAPDPESPEVRITALEEQLENLQDRLINLEKRSPAAAAA